MRFTHMNWAIKMGSNVCKELTDKDRAEIHLCAVRYGVVE
jgi:hypothetical protein